MGYDQFDFGTSGPDCQPASLAGSTAREEWHDDDDRWNLGQPDCDHRLDLLLVEQVPPGHLLVEVPSSLCSKEGPA